MRFVFPSNAPVAQRTECQLAELKVRGSNPLRRTFKIFFQPAMRSTTMPKCATAANHTATREEMDIMYHYLEQHTSRYDEDGVWFDVERLSQMIRQAKQTGNWENIRTLTTNTQPNLQQFIPIDLWRKIHMIILRFFIISHTASSEAY